MLLLVTRGGCSSKVQLTLCGTRSSIFSRRRDLHCRRPPHPHRVPQPLAYYRSPRLRCHYRRVRWTLGIA